MPRRSPDIVFATNFAKAQLAKVKSEVERRRWFDRFLVLAGLVKIELKDEQPSARQTEPVGPSLDERIKAAVQKMNGGDDVNTPAGD